MAAKLGGRSPRVPSMPRMSGQETSTYSERAAGIQRTYLQVQGQAWQSLGWYHCPHAGCWSLVLISSRVQNLQPLLQHQYDYLSQDLLRVGLRMYTPSRCWGKHGSNQRGKDSGHHHGSYPPGGPHDGHPMRYGLLLASWHTVQCRVTNESLDLGALHISKGISGCAKQRNGNKQAVFQAA